MNPPITSKYTHTHTHWLLLAKMFSLNEVKILQEQIFSLSIVPLLSSINIFTYLLITMRKGWRKIIAHLITKSRPTLCNPVDCSFPGSSGHAISHTRIPEWVPFTPPPNRSLSNPSWNMKGFMLKRTDSIIERAVGKFIPVWFLCDWSCDNVS